MAEFQITLCGSELCNGLRITDRTGFFSPDKPLGYNSPSPLIPTLLVDGTFGAASYSIDIYQAVEGGLDLNSTPAPTPLLTVNLMTWPHTVDATTGYVTWDFTFDQLGVEVMRSGWWILDATQVWTNSVPTTYTYEKDTTVAFIGDITAKVDELFAESDPDCECKKGCVPVEKVLMYAMNLCGQAKCADEAALTQNVDWLYDHRFKCC